MSVTGRLIASHEVHSEEWHEARRLGIGGSDVAAICGLSSYKSPYGLWLEKTGQLEPEEAGEAAYWGTVLEPLVMAEFQKRSGLVVEPGEGTYQHSDHEWMLYNPDAFVYSGLEPVSLYEGKTTSAYNKEHWQDDRVPNAAALQVQHGLAVTGLDGAYLACLIGGQTFVYREIARDDELIDMLITLEAEFWRRVVENDPPPVDGSERTTEALKRRYAPEPGKVIELDPTVYQLIADRNSYKQVVAEAEEAARKCENTVRTLLGEAEVGLCDETPVVSWKANKNGTRTLRFTKESA